MRQWVSLFLTLGFLLSCQSVGLRSSREAGVYHTIIKGQTLYRIAVTYGTSVETLARVNRIGDPSQLKLGRHIWIPGARRVLEVPIIKQASVSKGTSWKKKRSASGKNKRRLSKEARLLPPPKKSHRRFRWPVRGVLTSRFGKRGNRNHHGIDVGVKTGTPISAAAGGKVTFSGWGPTGYGLMVIVKHQDAFSTVYAHNSRNIVKKGMRVKTGQRIALVGSTGRSTGPHLHFEVRTDTQPMNPLSYLPPL